MAVWQSSCSSEMRHRPCACSCADGRQRLANRLEIRRRQQILLTEHLRVRDRGADVVGDQAIVQRVIIARGVFQNPRVERSTLVPEPRHECGINAAPAVPLGSRLSDPRPPACRCPRW